MTLMGLVGVERMAATGPAPVTVTVNKQSGQPDPTNVSPIHFDIIFSEPVTNFVATDLNYAGTTAGGTMTAVLGGGPTNWTASISGMTTTGNVAVTVPVGAVNSIATGAANLVSTPIDNVVSWNAAAGLGPTVTINKYTGQSDPTNLAPILFLITFSEPVTGFTEADINFSASTAGGSLTGVLEGPDLGAVPLATYNLSVSGMTTGGEVVATIPASCCTSTATGEFNSGSTSTDNSVTWSTDVTRPHVTINKAAGQSDPSTGTSILFTVVFDESVHFDNPLAVDLSTSTCGGTLNASISGSGPTYTVTVTGMAAPDGNVIATIPSFGVADLVGNLNFASTSTDNSVSWSASSDTTAPSVTVNKGSGQPDPTDLGLIEFDINFSESVLGLTASDFTITQTCGGTLVRNLIGTGPTNVYLLQITGMASPSGTVTVSLPAGSCTDIAGNSNTASTHTDNVVQWNFVPAGAWYTLYDATLPTNNVGWFTYTMRQYIAPAAYNPAAPATGTQLRITVQTADTTGVTWADVYVGHTAPSGDVIDFDGSQVLSKRAGASSGTIPAASTVTFDATIYPFNKTKGLVMGVNFNGPSDVRSMTPLANFQGGFILDGAGAWPGVTDVTVGGGQFDLASRCYFFKKVEVFG